MNLEENLVGIMNRRGKNDRKHEFQDSNDSASNPDEEAILSLFPFKYVNEILCCCHSNY